MAVSPSKSKAVRFLQLKAHHLYVGAAEMSLWILVNQFRFVSENKDPSKHFVVIVFHGIPLNRETNIFQTNST